MTIHACDLLVVYSYLAISLLELSQGEVYSIVSVSVCPVILLRCLSLMVPGR